MYAQTNIRTNGTHHFCFNPFKRLFVIHQLSLQQILNKTIIQFFYKKKVQNINKIQDRKWSKSQNPFNNQAKRKRQFKIPTPEIKIKLKKIIQTIRFWITGNCSIQTNCEEDKFFSASSVEEGLFRMKAFQKQTSHSTMHLYSILS